MASGANTRGSRISIGTHINEQTAHAGTASGDSFTAWKTSHRGLRELERALVLAIHAGGRMDAQRDLAEQIAAVRGKTRFLFEEAAKAEKAGLRASSLAT